MDEQEQKIDSGDGTGETIEVQQPTIKGKEVGKSGAFSKLSRELSDKDLKNPAVGRMLLDERDRLLQEKAVLESYKENYYKADKRADVCEAINSGATKNQMLYTISQTLGGAIFGVAFVFQDKIFWLLVFIGIILSGGSILISFISNKNKEK